jgi:anti-sigma factor RsiW
MKMPMLRRTDLVCQEAIELLTQYLEGTLSRHQRRRLGGHLDACPNCSAYLEQIRMTIRFTGSIEPADLSPRAVDELTELHRRWRAGEEQPRCAIEARLVRSA